MNIKTIIIGLGNTLLKDDGVGVVVATLLREELKDRKDIYVSEVCRGGLSLMENMVGYQKAIIIDAMVTGIHEPGFIRQFSLDEVLTSKNTVSTHDTNLAIAIETGKFLGLELPETIKIWGIEANDTNTFDETLTIQVQNAVPIVVDIILKEIGDSNLNISEKNPELVGGCK